MRRLASAMKAIIVSLLLGMAVFPATAAAHLHLRAQSPRELQEETTVHVVPLILALHFVEETTASKLETLDSSNEAVQQLCTVVQTQAQGPQVRNAAKEVNMTVVANDSVNECTLVGTNRAYDTGGEILGPNHLTMEVSLEQVVYVTANVSVTTEIVTEIVENGFNRGRGGRASFRALLQPYSNFGSLLDVEVLDQLGPPQEAPSSTPSVQPSLFPSGLPTELTTAVPTLAPTESPTLRPTPSPTEVPLTPPPSSSPTAAPSVLPSDAPSMLPSLVPSTVPSVQPSSTPSSIPSLLPTFAPTMSPVHMANPPADEPSSMPSILPSAQPSSEPFVAVNTNDRVAPGIIAGIVGGCLALLATCCFSFYLCASGRRQKRADADDDARIPIHPHTAATSSSGRKHVSSSKTSSQERSSLTFVPEVVQLDDDHQSLANTTLGEHTAGRKPPKKKRMVDMDVTMDSFEEESLYTMGIAPRIQHGHVIEDDDTQSGGLVSPPPLGAVNVEYEDTVFFPDGGDSSEIDSPFKVPPSPMSRKIGNLVEQQLGPAAEDEPGSTLIESLAVDGGRVPPPPNDKEDKVNLKFSDGSSVNPWPTQQLSPASIRSKWAPNTEDATAIVAISSTDTSKDTPKVEETSLVPHKSVIESELDRVQDQTPQSPFELLEDEDRKARVSPIDLVGVQQAEGREDASQLLQYEENQTDVSPIELRDILVADEKPSNESVESQVLASRKSPFSWNPPSSSDTFIQGVDPQTTARGSVSPSRTRFPQDFASPKSYGSSLASFAAEAKSPTFHTPNSVASDPGKPTNLAATCTQLVVKSDGDKNPSFPLVHDPSLGSSSSGTSTGGENPWLFDTVTETLGPRSASADMESLSGRSNRSGRSQRSAKSYRSHRSNRSGRSRGSRLSRKRRASRSVGSLGSRNSFRSGIDQKSDSKISIEPWSLENELDRLETHLATLNNTHMEPSVIRSAGESTSMSVSGLSRGSHSTHRKVSNKQRIIVVVPPGKLGVILANRHDGKGTVVSDVRPTSLLKGAIARGDRLVAIDGEDVTTMNVSQITAIMTKKSHLPRHLTLITSTKIRSRAQESPKTDLVSTSESDVSP